MWSILLIRSVTEIQIKFLCVIFYKKLEMKIKYVRAVLPLLLGYLVFKNGCPSINTFEGAAPELPPPVPAFPPPVPALPDFLPQPVPALPALPQPVPDLPALPVPLIPPQQPQLTRNAIMAGLLISIGIAWELSQKSKKPVDMGFSILLFASYWWYLLWCHNEQNKAKLVLVMIAIITGILIWINARENPRISLLLLPLMFWIIFVEHLPKVPQRVEFPFVSIEFPRLVDGHVRFRAP